MSDWQQNLDRASDAWREWCATLERTGLAALEHTMTHDEIDLAEGLRYLSRIARLTLLSYSEHVDSHHPAFYRSLGPTLKMGGDNPEGLYLSAPINGTDTFRIRGTRGSAAWVSILAQRDAACLNEGLSVFGDALFSTGLKVNEDGTFELIISPDKHPGNWIQSDRYSAVLMVRQFFGSWDDVRPMDLVLENLSRPSEPPTPLTLDDAISRLQKSALYFSLFVPVMQSELINKADSVNHFKTDFGDPTSNHGGVPGGNAVTARWRLEEDEALLIRVTPPNPCPYWDIQVGNGWYESWDYRYYFSGITAPQAVMNADGSVTLVISQRDPGTANWLEAAHHREGHVAIRWQLTEGQLPIPECTVVKVEQVAALTALPRVDATERQTQRHQHRQAVDRRFRL